MCIKIDKVEYEYLKQLSMDHHNKRSIKTKDTPPKKKKSYSNSPPKYMTTLIIPNQNHSPFCHE